MPALEGLLPHVHQRLTTGWDRVLKNSGRSGAAAAQLGANTREGSSAANEEIIAERLLRELLAEHLILLRGTQDTVGGTPHTAWNPKSIVSAFFCVRDPPSLRKATWLCVFESTPCHSDSLQDLLQ